MITINILESPAKNRLLVSWRQSGLCNYTEQVWALHNAVHPAHCAISGQPVRRGDKVYRPVGKPMNHGTCILADAAQSIMATRALGIPTGAHAQPAALAAAG